MKNQTNTNLVIRLSLALALALAIWTPVQARAAEPAEVKKTAEATMMEQCKAMQEQKQKMTEDMKAQDAQLTEQLAKMNSAPADKKMDLMAALVTRMVEQRIAMDARMAKMHEEMMQHMMQHMQMGKESMAQCPMMTGMKGMDKNAKEKGMNMSGQTQDTTKSVASSQATMNMGEGEMDMVHPFFTHMGMPDAVGHYALRLSGVAARNEGHTDGDFGFHLETGLSDRIGLHIRNDRVLNNAHTEIMLQYAAIRSRDGMSGFSPFIELEVPTHQDEHHFYGLVGFSTMWSTHRFQLNQSLEYSPEEKALEGSVSMVGKIGQRLFPVAEFIFAASKDATPQNSVIAGLKYRINKSIAFGVGYQVPVTETREFTRQALLQTDIEW